MLFLFLNCFRHVGRNIRSQLMKSGGSLDREYLLEVFNLIMWTSTFRSTSTFQWSSTRLSRNRSRFVCVILVTSMYFNGMFLFLACKVELQNRRGNDKWNLTLRTSASSFVSVGSDPSEFLWSSRSFPPLSGFSVSIISSTQLGCPIYDWEIWRKLFWASLLLLRWFFEHRFLTRPNLQAPQCLQPQYLLFELPTAINTHPKHIPGFFPGALTALRRDRKIFSEITGLFHA